MRPIWSASLSFSLVNIPVRVYSGASDDDKVKFHMLHEKDLSPVGYAKFCKAEGTEITNDEIVRGYEYSKGEYVVVSDEELEHANVARTRSIELLAFVEVDEIPMPYFEKPYYLEPDKGADKAYVLLRDALRDSRKVGVAKYVMRNRESLAVVQPVGDILVLEQIRFASQVRDAGELRQLDVTADPSELELALTLIKHGSRAFDPGEFRDTYSEEVQRVIADKVEGRVPAQKGEAPQPTNVQDLMSVLKASLDRQKRTEQVA
ncbi:MAG: Ku protein [Chloroflexota bacterium]